MRYVDRNGESIDSFSWHRLACTPAYCLLAEERVGRWRVRASWVGVILHHEEAAPRPFLVEVVATGGGGERHPGCPDQWVVNEAQAGVVMQAAVKRLRLETEAA